MTNTVTLNHWISGGGTASMAGHAMTTESPSITSTLLFPESITDGGTAKIMHYYYSWVYVNQSQLHPAYSTITIS
jgi:hypothetical protein